MGLGGCDQDEVAGPVTSPLAISGLESLAGRISMVDGWGCSAGAGGMLFRETSAISGSRSETKELRCQGTRLAPPGPAKHRPPARGAPLDGGWCGSSGAGELLFRVNLRDFRGAQRGERGVWREPPAWVSAPPAAMSFLKSFPPPGSADGVRQQQSDTEAVLNGQGLGTGTLYIAERWAAAGGAGRWARAHVGRPEGAPGRGRR